MIDRRRALKILVLSALGLVPVPSTAMALIVPRSWYGWSFTLTGKSITTPAQYFDGNNIGIVNDVGENRATSLLSVKKPDGQTFLVPFVKELVPGVDLDKGIVIVNMIDGLDG